MNYQAKELLPIVTELSEKYTSKESSSIPYHTAQMLMGAVIYCINETIHDNEKALLTSKTPSAKAMYEKGYELVIQKVYQAKEIYDDIIRDFEDYGCLHYRDTILNGMPSFFSRYDPRFNPQDHLLTLDYPLMNPNPALTGIDQILYYLTETKKEQCLLKRFPREVVLHKLETISSDYQELYLDNICDAVLG